MTVKITPKKLTGCVEAVYSKSFAIRAIVAASLAFGVSIIENVQFCDDVKTTLFAIEKFGAKFSIKNNSLKIYGGLNNLLEEKKIYINCKDSALNFRLFSFLAATSSCDIYLKGTENLFKRPLVADLYFNKNRFNYIKKERNCFKVVNRLKPGKFFISCKISSQFLTGLLFSLPILDDDSEIIVEKIEESKQYVDFTLYVLKQFGIKIKRTFKGFKVLGRQKFKSFNFKVPVDHSQMAFFEILGAFNPIKIVGLKKSSLQKDCLILKIIKRSGLAVNWQNGFVIVSRKKNKLKPFKVSVNKTPDLALPLAVFACFCDGVSKIYRISRLCFKESNRVKSIVSLITAVGGKVFLEKDCIKINGGNFLNGGFVKGFADHRVVMAAFIISSFCKNFVFVSDVETIFKSNVKFLSDFKSLGGCYSGICLE